MCVSTKWFFFMLAAHMCSGRPGRRRLHRAEFLRRLGAVSQGKGRGQIEFGRLLARFDQRGNRDLAEQVPRPLLLAEVHLNQAAVGLMDGAQRLAGLEVDDRILLEALVRFAPAQNGDFNHGRILGRTRKHEIRMTKEARNPKSE